MFAVLYDNWINKSNLAIRHMNELQSKLERDDVGIDDLSIKDKIELLNRLHFINTMYYRIKGMPRPKGATAVLEEPEWQLDTGLICGR